MDNSFLWTVTLGAGSMSLILLALAAALILPVYTVVRLERLSKGGWKAETYKYMPWGRTKESWVCGSNYSLAEWYNTTTGEKTSVGHPACNALNSAVERRKDVTTMHGLVNR